MIPRAAGALFEHLTGAPAGKKNGSSSLRTPTRYSTSSAQNLPTLAALGKSSEGNPWQMKATYVEVRRNGRETKCESVLTAACRFITSSCGISSCRRTFYPTNVPR